MTANVVAKVVRSLRPELESEGWISHCREREELSLVDSHIVAAPFYLQGDKPREKSR